MGSTHPSYWSADASSARAARFGRFLLAWRSRAGWTQYELPRWAKAAGFIGPSIGSMSQLENGITKTPTMALFSSLAEANRRLVAGDFSGVKDRKLLDRLQKGVPVLDAAGRPWGFDEFVKGFHLPDQVDGEIWESSSGRNAVAPELTSAELERVNSTLRDGFRPLMAEVKPLSRALAMAARSAPPAERVAFEEALTGQGYSVERLQGLWDPDAGEWAPLVWWSAVLRTGRSETP